MFDLTSLGGTDAELPRLLKESDFVVVSVPLLPQTKGMIGIKANDGRRQNGWWEWVVGRLERLLEVDFKEHAAQVGIWP